MVFKQYSRALAVLIALFVAFPSFTKEKKKQTTASTKKNIVKLKATYIGEPGNIIEYYYEHKSNDLIVIHPFYPKICGAQFALDLPKDEREKHMEQQEDEYKNLDFTPASKDLLLIGYPKDINLIFYETKDRCLEDILIYRESMPQMKKFYLNIENKDRVEVALASVLDACDKAIQADQTDN